MVLMSSPRRSANAAAVIAATALSITLLIGNPNSAYAQTTVTGIVVPGRANPFLAGQPNGTDGSDMAPTESPTQVTGLNLTGGFLTFAVTGSVDYSGGVPTDPPDGEPFGAGFYDTPHAADNGIGGYHAPANAMVGVFLDGSDPTATDAPASLDFTSGAPTQLGTDFTTLSPKLKQVFFIGDGLTGDRTGAVQKFFVPNNATQLYLGTVDGGGWYNNSGQFNVVATSSLGSGASSAPEPGALTLLAGGVGILPVGLRLRRKSGSGAAKRG